jgi:glycosyltransferase involved in cell wall biosynthesis
VIDISVVTLSHNQGEFISEAIKSVLNQDNEKEYFVYDVGSTDSSRTIIQEFSSKLQPIFVDKDLGPSDGLNRVFDRATGSIFYYLNSDDKTVPGAFDFVLKYFSENPDCDVLHGSIRIISRSGKPIAIKPSMKFTLRGYALGYSVVYQQATFFKKEIFAKTKFNLENRTCWDGELIVDMAIAGAQIHRTSKILGEFRIYSDSITGSGRLRNQIKKDHQRIASRILGRKINWFDFVLGNIYSKVLAFSRLRFVLCEKEMKNLYSD